MIVVSYGWFLFTLYMVHWKFNALPLVLVFDYAQKLTIVTGLLGLIFGFWLTFRARKAFDDGLSVSYLGPGHSLTQRVHRLADELGLPHPKVGTMWVANAYAAGSTRQEAVVVIGQPLINILTEEELDAIIGHELGHIASGDVQRMQFAVGYQQTYNTILEKIGKVAGVAGDVAGSDRRGEAQGIAIVLYLIGAIALLTRWLVGSGSEVVLMGLSRSREFHADAVGAALTSPAAMAVLSSGCMPWITPSRTNTATSCSSEQRASSLLIRRWKHAAGRCKRAITSRSCWTVPRRVGEVARWPVRGSALRSHLG